MIIGPGTWLISGHIKVNRILTNKDVENIICDSKLNKDYYMDPRFNKSKILDRRKSSWTNDNVKHYVEKLFEKISLLENWELVSVDWTKKGLSKTKEELKHHIMNMLSVTIKNDKGKETEYLIQIPELIEDQFFYIGGYLKIPIFQLIDKPVIYRHTPKKTLIRLKTNTISLSININSFPYTVSVFGKKIDFEELITATHTKEEFDSWYNNLDSPNDMLEDIRNKCMNLWEDTTQEERINKIGHYFYSNNYDETKKGKSVIFSLKAAYEIDIFSKKFFKTDSVLFEVLNALQEGPRSDTDLENKRIRYLEYIVSPLVRKFYDMVIALKNNPNMKFQIPKTIIEDNCNVSDIVHFNFPMNPVGEIASLLQCTLTGPGGFKKENVPSHLRTLDDSQLGRICPADTPDRDGCGVVLNMVPTVNIDKFGCFADPCDEVVSSFPISLSPFMKNNDQTRLQMASNQMKQTILLKNADKPFIRTGTEGCYVDNSTFLYKAKNDGEVVHLDPSFMVVLYKDGTKDIFKARYRTLYQNTLDYLEPMVNAGESFKKNDILCQSKFLKDGDISLGKNLLAGIAIWKGFNYEDGIVISETVARDKLTSLHSVDLSFGIEPGQVLLNITDDHTEYIPIPKIGQRLKKGEVYSKIKTLDSDDGFEAINIDPMEKCAPVECVVTSIEIYPNGWNKKINDYHVFINELMAQQADRFIQLKNKLSEFMEEEEIEKFITLHGLSRLDCNSRKGKYTFRGQKVSGVFIKINAVYEEKIGIGDKVANRHGGKGVISGIIPDEKMPTLSDGRKLDIILNPLGIISRMNVGQLYELHLNEALYQLKNKLKSYDISKGGKYNFKKDISIISSFLKIADKTPSKWVSKEIIANYKKDIKYFGRETAIDNLYLIQPPFQSITPTDLLALMFLSDAKFLQTLFDPDSGLELKNPIAIGYMYFLKLVHRASDKISARSIGPYGKKTLQPLGGKSRKGGQRLGEMEVWALMGHGAKNFLSDLLTIHSDSPGLKNKLLSELLENPDLTSSDNSDEKPQSLRLLQSYFSVMGVSLDDEIKEDIGEKNDSS